MGVAFVCFSTLHCKLGCGIPTFINLRLIVVGLYPGHFNTSFNINQTKTRKSRYQVRNAPLTSLF